MTLYFLGLPNAGFSKDRLKGMLGEALPLADTSTEWGTVTGRAAPTVDVMAQTFQPGAARDSLRGKIVEFEGMYGPIDQNSFTVFDTQKVCCAADTILVRSVAGPYLRLLQSSGDEIADLPIDETWDDPGRGAILYGKAALGFLAIRVEIGDDDFFAAIRGFAETWAFRIAEPGDLLAAFETASGDELDALWSRWFEQAETTPSEVDQLLSDS